MTSLYVICGLGPSPQSKILATPMGLSIRGGVEDTRLKAKDTKKFRGQGQTLSRPRTHAQGFSKKKGLQKFFSSDLKKKVFKIFFQAKRSSNIVLIISNLVSVVKDLGIHVSDNLKWSFHVCHIYNVASMWAFQVLHSFSSRNIWTLLKAYTTYVRPKLEYNTVVWSPFLHKDINLVESVQKKFTRHICTRCKICFNSYSDRLSKLNINSLEYRRLEFDLILMFKISHNL